MARRPSARREALRPIWEAGRVGDVELLLETVKREPDSFVRGAAVRQLGLLHERSAVEPLRRLLKANTKDFGLQTVTIRALARIGDVSASDDLYRLAATDRDSTTIQLTAALALVNLGDRRAVPIMARFVVDDRFTQRQMKWALKKLRVYKGVEAIPALRAGGSRRLGPIDRLRVRMLLRNLESDRHAD